MHGLAVEWMEILRVFYFSCSSLKTSFTKFYNMVAWHWIHVLYENSAFLDSFSETCLSSPSLLVCIHMVIIFVILLNCPRAIILWSLSNVLVNSSIFHVAVYTWIWDKTCFILLVAAFPRPLPTLCVGILTVECQ